MDPNAALSSYTDLSSKTSTFISIDVVGSTQLKNSENDQDILYTFLSYHKLIRELAYNCHGEIITVSGDGVMCRFERADDAASAVKQILEALPDFNKHQNRLSRSMSIRMGINTGQVYEHRDVTPGQLASHTIDVAGKLQQGCQPNQARFSQETVNALKQTQLPLTRLEWDATLKTTIYQYAGSEEVRSVQRVLPQPVKVLIVEDDPAECLLLKKIMWARRHEPMPVYNAEQAALCTTTWKPHVIMISIDLPWNAGWELLKAIRAETSASKIPVLLMSRETTGENVERCFGLGANGFIRKPLEEQPLIKRVDMVLREFYL
jgi:CheY-like chemotaxis protein/class 3 adenylate cyclase